MVTGISLCAQSVIILSCLNIYGIYTFILFYLLSVALIYICCFRIFNFNRLRDSLAATILFVKGITKTLLQKMKKPNVVNFNTRAYEYIQINFLPIVLLCLAVVIGIYTRMSYSFLHLTLPSIDPYGHLYVTKVLNKGILYQPLGFYDDYPRGFHSIVSVIHFYSGLDTYCTMRFLGGMFGLISMGSMYCFISSFDSSVHTN